MNNEKRLQDCTIKENNLKSLEDIFLDFYVSNLSSNYDAHCKLYDYLLNCKMTAISDSAMDAYQKVMDYLKNNFIEIKEYVDIKE